MYACVAATKGNARCRNKAMEGSKLCAMHQALVDEGKNVPCSPEPDKVLFKYKINPAWVKRLEDLGVPFKKPDFAAKEKSHEEHSKQHGREAFAIRSNVADSGTPIFGKGGLSNVGTFGVFQQLLNIFNIVSIHMQPSHPTAKNQAMSVLVISFSRGEEEGGNASAYQEILRFVAVGDWEHCHVWVNPPQANGEIIHTVNMAHRPDNQNPRTPNFTLSFDVQEGWITQDLANSKAS